MSDFVTFKLANKLNKKGFPNHISNYVYIVKDTEENSEEDFYEKEFASYIPDYLTTIGCPTISQVLKWLKEEKKIYIAIDFFRSNGNTDMWWTYSVRYIEDDSTENIFESCRRKSWEQAALAGIEYVLDSNVI